MGKNKTMDDSGKRQQEKGSAPNRDSQLAAGGELHLVAGGDLLARDSFGCDSAATALAGARASAKKVAAAININEPLAGNYSAQVHYFSDHGNGPTVATLRLYLYGNLVAEHSQLLNDGEWWNVGFVSWPSMGIGVWNEVNTVAAQ